MSKINSVIKLIKEKITPLLKDPLFLGKWVSSWEIRDENRITTRVSGGGYRRIDNKYRGDLYMFTEDMYQGIMPFNYVRKNGTQFEVTIEPYDGAVESNIAEVLDKRGYRQDLRESLCDFIRNVAQTLFFYGRDIFEIVYDKDSNGKINNFQFVSVYPQSIKRIFGRYYQVIPWWVAKRSRGRAGIKRIPKNKIMIVDFPKELGGRRALRKIIGNLSRLSKDLIPEFQMEAMKDNRNIGFDLSQYVRSKYIEKAQLTRMFGWHQRKIPDDEILEFYSIYRHLRYAYSQAVIREHILDALNRTLGESVLNLPYKIIMTGIPTSKDINHELEIFYKGELKFTDLFNRTSI